MGTWDINAFANDDAMDWSYGLEDQGIGLIHSTIKTVSEFPVGEYMESYEGSIALAAVELVAASRVPSLKQRVHPDVLQWLDKANLSPDNELLMLSRQALERILANNSELKELWADEPDENSKWLAYVDELKAALQ